jgi:hypothetical protein
MSTRATVTFAPSGKCIVVWYDAYPEYIKWALKKARKFTGCDVALAFTLLVDGEEAAVDGDYSLVDYRYTVHPGYGLTVEKNVIPISDIVRMARGQYKVTGKKLEE